MYSDESRMEHSECDHKAGGEVVFRMRILKSTRGLHSFVERERRHLHRRESTKGRERLKEDQELEL